MSDQFVFERDAKVPFILSLVEKVDLSLYEDAVNALRDQAASYDPVTQTSGVPILASSSRTYYDTTTGMVFKDDEGKDT